MVDWQLTATTIYCDTADEEVTLLVYQDGSAKCTGYKKHGEPDKEMPAKGGGKQLKQQMKCDGPECYRLIQYKDKLFSEKGQKGARKKP